VEKEKKKILISLKQVECEGGMMQQIILEICIKLMKR